MNVVDSSGWLEYFADGLNAEAFAPTIENIPELVVPTISIYEVFKRMHQQRGEEFADMAAAQMAQGKVVLLTKKVALTAAKLSIEHKLPMADSIILATARVHKATLWTQDADFAGIDGVRYIEKPKSESA
jgi:toxin FitB